MQELDGTSSQNRNFIALKCHRSFMEISSNFHLDFIALSTRLPLAPPDQKHPDTHANMTPTHAPRNCIVSNKETQEMHMLFGSVLENVSCAQEYVSRTPEYVSHIRRQRKSHLGQPFHIHAQTYIYPEIRKFPHTRKHVFQETCQCHKTHSWQWTRVAARCALGIDTHKIALCVSTLPS